MAGDLALVVVHGGVDGDAVVPVSEWGRGSAQGAAGRRERADEPERRSARGPLEAYLDVEVALVCDGRKRR